MQNIVAVHEDKRSEDDGKEKDCRHVCMIGEQLRDIDCLKWIPSAANNISDLAAMNIPLT